MSYVDGRKTQTPFAETEALLAVMEEDEDEALRILDEMLPGERRAFMDHLNRLSMLADDTQRCPRCKRMVEPLDGVSVGLARPRQIWHRGCLADQRAEGRS